MTAELQLCADTLHIRVITDASLRHSDPAWVRRNSRESVLSSHAGFGTDLSLSALAAPGHSNINKLRRNTYSILQFPVPGTP